MYVAVADFDSYATNNFNGFHSIWGSVCVSVFGRIFGGWLWALAHICVSVVSGVLHVKMCVLINL